MVTYITSLFAFVTKAVSYKNGSAFITGLGAAIMLTGAENVWNAEFMGFSYSFLMLACVLIMLDFFTGALASRYEQKKSPRMV